MIIAHLAADTRVGVELRFTPFSVGEVQHLEVRFDIPPPVPQNEIKQNITARNETPSFISWPIINVAQAQRTRETVAEFGR